MAYFVFFSFKIIAIINDIFSYFHLHLLSLNSISSSVIFVAVETIIAAVVACTCYWYV